MSATARSQSDVHSTEFAENSHHELVNSRDESARLRLLKKLMYPTDGYFCLYVFRPNSSRNVSVAGFGRRGKGR